MLGRRIALLATLALSLLAAPLAVEAQSAARIPRVGFLGAVTPEDFPHLDEGFRQGLREFGYVEGQNIIIEYRWAEGRAERLPALAAELATGARGRRDRGSRVLIRDNGPSPKQRHLLLEGCGRWLEVPVWDPVERPINPLRRWSPAALDAGG